MQRGASEKKKKGGAVLELSKGSEVEVEAAPAQPKQVTLAQVHHLLFDHQVSARQERIINMIDALLGEEGEEGKEEMLHCSLDSIDRLGDSLTQFEKARWKAEPLLQFIVSRLPLDN